MNALFLVPFTTEGASNRLRVEQYLPLLRKQGIDWTLRPFLCSPRFYEVLYRPGRLAHKGWFFLVSSLYRLLDLLRSRKFDLVLIHREAFPFGPPALEWLLSRCRIPIVYDFDDAIWQPNCSDANRAFQALKSPGKIAAIIGLSRRVIAGNNYLRDYALAYNRDVTVIPTPVDTDRLFPVPRRDGGPVTLGWIGSHTSGRYLTMLDEVFVKLARRYDVRMRIVGATYDPPVPHVAVDEWRLDREVSDLQSFDIGLMPMPDGPWTRGKCALKALQYMAVGIPVVCSPVGMNREVVTDGATGFFARSTEEWVEKLALLIDDPGLRQAMGQRGQAVVETQYSVRANFPKFLEVLEQALTG